MARSINAVIFLLFVLAALLTVPILIGVYVYRDDTRRRMNAALWTLIAVAASGLIGFIIYLLIRGNYPDLANMIRSRHRKQCARRYTIGWTIWRFA